MLCVLLWFAPIDDRRWPRIHFLSLDAASAPSPTPNWSPATGQRTGVLRSGWDLEYFLAERYCLYTVDERQRIRRVDIHHPPWTLQPAVATVDRNTMTVAREIDLPGDRLLHFAARRRTLASVLTLRYGAGAVPGRH